MAKQDEALKQILQELDKAVGGLSSLASSFNNLILTGAIPSVDDLTDKVIPAAETLHGLFKDNVKTAEQQKKLARELGKAEFELADTESLRNQLHEVKNMLQESSIDLFDVHIKQLENEIGILDATNEKMKVKNKLISEGVDLATRSFDKLSSAISNLPGGSLLLSAIDLDTIREDTRGMIADVLQGGSSIVHLFEAGMLSISGLISTVGKALSTLLLNPAILLITTFGLLATVATSRLSDVFGSMSSIRKETGFLGDDLERVNDSVVRTNRNLAHLGVGLDEARDASSAVLENFGSSVFLTDDVVGSTARMTAILGLGASESANLVALFSDMTGSTGEIATNLIASTVKLAQARGVAPATVMKDIASSSGRIFDFTNGLPETLGRTAIEARRLGISLDTVATIAERLMDFESSIESELNAMVLTGRNLNLEQARYLAITGDTAGMLSELREQIGSYSQLQGLLPFQQKALAEALGLSTGELRRMVRTQEDLDRLSAGTLDTFTAFQRGAKLSDVLNAQDALTPFEHLSAATKALFVQFADALVPAAKALTSILTVVASALNKVSGFVSGVTDKISDLTGGLSDTVIGFLTLTGVIIGVVATVKILKALIGNPATGLFSSIGKGLGTMISSFAAINPVGLLIFAGVMTVLTLSFMGFSKSLKMIAEAMNIAIPFFKMVFEGIGKTIVTIGSVMVSIIGSISDSFIRLGDNASNLARAASGIVMLSQAMVAFSAATAVSSIGTFFSEFLGESIINRLERLSKLGPGLVQTANALSSDSIRGIAATNRTATTQEITSSGIKRSDLDALMNKIDEVVNAITNKDTDIKLDGRSLKVQLAKS